MNTFFCFCFCFRLPGPVVSWRTPLVLRKVVAELDRPGIRGEGAASSVSASVLVRRYGSVKLVPWPHIRAITGVGSAGVWRAPQAAVECGGFTNAL